MSRAGTYHIIMEQGATFRRTFLYQDTDGNPIAIIDARMKARENITSDELFSLMVGSGITLGSPGQLTIMRSASDTAGYDFNTARYDIEVTRADGTVDRMLEGNIELSAEVTK